MRILIDIVHPGHVHLFKYFYFETSSKHEVVVTIRDIKIIRSLLEFYKIPFIILGKKRDTLFGKALTIIRDDIQLLRIAKKYKINVGLSSGIVLSQISKLTNIKSFVFDDDDDAAEPLIVKYGHPFSESLLTPDCVLRKSKKSIFYAGTHELAYLHPLRFSPDPKVPANYGIELGENYFILRFVAFKGHHDGGHSGITFEQKVMLIDLLKNYGRVFITAEREIESDLEQYRIPVPPEKIHSFIAFSTMFIGDSQTMTSEAAILGVPALKCNTFAGKLSVPNELEQKYGLCYSYQPDQFDKFYAHTKQLLGTPNLKNIWAEKRKKFLADKIDVTGFMVWFIENYPESKQILKENPEYQYRFR